jgi:HEAT repeat protein
MHNQADIALQETDRQKAIAALVELIKTSQDKSTCRCAAESLGKIDPGNPKAIAALVKLIKTSQYEDIRRRAADSLGEIGVGNQSNLSSAPSTNTIGFYRGRMVF